MQGRKVEKNQGRRCRKRDGDFEHGKDSDRFLKSCKVGGKKGRATRPTEMSQKGGDQLGNVRNEF